MRTSAPTSTQPEQRHPEQPARRRTLRRAPAPAPPRADRRPRSGPRSRAHRRATRRSDPRRADPRGRRWRARPLARRAVSAREWWPDVDMGTLPTLVVSGGDTLDCSCDATNDSGGSTMTLRARQGVSWPARTMADAPDSREVERRPTGIAGQVQARRSSGVTCHVDTSSSDLRRRSGTVASGAG